jgi:nucleolar GTP-binding protein
LCTEHYLLPNADEKYDVIPEIWQGKNIADFIDPDIMKVSLWFLMVV